MKVYNIFLCLFFLDGGHSFDNVLLYGNEFTLAVFDIIVFCFVEILLHDFLLAAVVTACCAQVSGLNKFEICRLLVI